MSCQSLGAALTSISPSAGGVVTVVSLVDDTASAGVLVAGVVIAVVLAVCAV